MIILVEAKAEWQGFGFEWGQAANRPVKQSERYVV